MRAPSKLLKNDPDMGGADPPATPSGFRSVSCSGQKWLFERMERDQARCVCADRASG